MNEIKAYRCDCGKVYVTKSACVKHEKVCKSWKNPKHRTCKTCKFGKQVWDTNGMENDPHSLQSWQIWQCDNPEFNYNIHFTAADKTAPDLCINCPVWKSKKP